MKFDQSPLTPEERVVLERLRAQPDRVVFHLDCQSVSHEKAMDILAKWKERLK